MSNIMRLLKVQIYNYFSVNELLDRKTKKKNSMIIAAVSIFTILMLLAVYNVFIAVSLVKMGQQALIPAYMAAMSSFIIMIFTLLRSNGILFGSRDYEMLSALPVRNKEIISSKFAFMYLLNLLLGFLFLVPAGIVWLLSTPDSTVSFLLYIISAPFVPVIPMCIASLAGVLITAISSKFRNSKIYILILSFGTLGITLGIGIYSMQSGQIGDSIGAILASQISRLYPLASWFDYQSEFAFIYNMALWLLSAAIFWVFIKITSLYYAKINSFILQCNTKMGTAKNRYVKHSAFTAMYRKESGRFFSSYLYVLNTGLGIVCLCIFSLLLCFISPDTLGQYAGIENASSFLGQYAPLIIAAMLSISCPAASSISLEGKNIWILQNAPLSMKTFLDSKIAVTLSLHAVGYVLSAFVFLLRFRLSLIQTAALIITPIAYSVFTAVQGIYINCRFPNFNWENEMVVIKQSISAILSGFAGMVSVAIPALLHWFLAIPLQTVLWTTVLVLAGLSGILYYKACHLKII